MSRNEGDEEMELLVRTFFLHLKTNSVLRVTVVREGMSIGEDREKRNTLQNDGRRTVVYAIVFSISS